MLKPISFSFLVNYSSLFSDLKKKLIDQKQNLKTSFHSIIGEINKTSEYIKEYNAYFGDRIKSLHKYDITQSIKPNEWIDIENKLKIIQNKYIIVSQRLDGLIKIMDKVKFYQLMSTSTYNNEMKGIEKHKHFLQNKASRIASHSCLKLFLELLSSHLLSFRLCASLFIIIVLVLFSNYIISFFISLFDRGELDMLALIGIPQAIYFYIFSFIFILAITIFMTYYQIFLLKRREKVNMKIFSFILGMFFLLGEAYTV